MGTGMRFKSGDVVVTQVSSRALMSHDMIPQDSVVEIVDCELAYGFEYYGFKTESGALGSLYGASLAPIAKE